MQQTITRTMYVPDFEKIDTLDKLKAIFIAVGFAFDDQNPFFPFLQPLLKEITVENQETMMDDMRASMEALGLEKVETSNIISIEEAGIMSAI